MGMFSFIQEIAMDLGTANTIIISGDKIVVDEPSVVALDRHTGKMIAVGENARQYSHYPPTTRWGNCRLYSVRTDDARTY